jgi:hypothetical protein
LIFPKTGGCWQNADVKILMAAMTFFALLVVLLVPDGCLSSELLESGWLPEPIR